MIDMAQSSTQPEDPMSDTSELVIANVHNQSRLVTCKVVTPLKIFNPDDCRETCHVVLSNYGGGFVQGDRVNIRFECGERARLFLGSQANTRIYKCEDKKDCSQHIQGILHDHAVAIVFPDPLVLHAASRFQQFQHWKLTRQSTLILSDVLFPGRLGIGEKFDFDSFLSRLHITLDSQLVIKDDFAFNPERDHPEHIGSFGRYAIFMNVYFVGPEMEACIQPLEVDMVNFGFPLPGQAPHLLSNRPASPGLFTINAVNGVGFILRALLNEPAQAIQLRDRICTLLRSFGIEENIPMRYRP